MSSTRRKLLDLIVDPDAAYAIDAAELEPLQLQAAQELFEIRRRQTADGIDFGNCQLMKETPRVGRYGLKVTSLGLRVEGSKC